MDENVCLACSGSLRRELGMSGGEGKGESCPLANSSARFAVKLPLSLGYGISPQNSQQIRCRGKGSGHMVAICRLSVRWGPADTSTPKSLAMAAALSVGSIEEAKA